MYRKPEPCEICGSPIVWAVNQSGFEVRLNPGRATGGYPLTYGTVSGYNYMLMKYRRHDLGPMPGDRLVYSQHHCKTSSKNRWTGDPLVLRGLWPRNLVLPPNHPWYGLIIPVDRSIEGDAR